MNKFIKLIRPDLREFAPYRSARDETKSGKIWLNANESPFDFQLHNGIKLNRYPQRQPAKLVERIAKLLNVDSHQVAVSRGSDEMIDLLIRLFCVAGQDAVLTCTPTYGMYSVYAKLQGCQLLEVPLLKDKLYQIDLNAILKHVEQNVKMIFLCSPNNPTGNTLNKDDILALCKAVANKSIVVVDEAYIDFADVASLSSCIAEYENLVILRTLSKAYGLAGARFGILLANEQLIEWILKIIAPYPLPSLVTKLVFDALSPELVAQIKQEIACIKVQRDQLFEILKRLPYISKVWPSETNFILFETVLAEKIMRLCAEEGIVLRSMFDKKGLKNCIRVSIGLPDENKRFIQVMCEVK